MEKIKVLKGLDPKKPYYGAGIICDNEQHFKEVREQYEKRGYIVTEEYHIIDEKIPDFTKAINI